MCIKPLQAYRVAGVRQLSFKHNADGVSVEVPCGKCIGCRLDYSRQWAIRSTLEARLYEHNHFITLTYNDDNIPAGASLNPDDLKTFIKSVRDWFRYNQRFTGIRFFGSGEYGDKSARPHYHLIMYNLPLSDLKRYKRNHENDWLYNSALLEQLWGKGFVVVAPVNFETSAYVARYVTKKVNGPIAKEIYGDRVPEFSRVSRRPGIGGHYFQLNKADLARFDSVFITTKDGVIAVQQPAYYDRLFGDGILTEDKKFERQERALARAKTESHIAKEYQHIIKARKINNLIESAKRLPRKVD